MHYTVSMNNSSQLAAILHSHSKYKIHTKILQFSDVGAYVLKETMQIGMFRWINGSLKERAEYVINDVLEAGDQLVGLVDVTEHSYTRHIHYTATRYCPTIETQFKLRTR